MPLMLQVGFGYPALIAGCMMAPTAMGRFWQNRP
jgi:hypothetical protein